MTRTEVKDSLNQESYSVLKVRELINKVEYVVPDPTPSKCQPTKLKLGDVILMPAGLKVRPCVIIKIKKDLIHFVPLTTTENHQVLMPCSGRFFGYTSFFTKSVLTTTHEIAISHFAGVYDKPSDIKKVITALSECFGFLTN